jgi:hypothetical protein
MAKGFVAFWFNDPDRRLHTEITQVKPSLWK